MNPQYHITQAANLEPVSVDEVTQHVRIDSIEDHAYLSDLISVAREYVDGLTGRVSNATGWTMTASKWDDVFISQEKGENEYALQIHKTPLASVSSVKYYDRDNALTTIDPADYLVFTKGSIGYIQLKKEPEPTFDRIDAIQIVFTAGMQEANPITKHAVKMMVAHLYENRVPVSFGATAIDIPYTLQAMILNQKSTGFL